MPRHIVSLRWTPAGAEKQVGLTYAWWKPLPEENHEISHYTHEVSHSPWKNAGWKLEDYFPFVALMSPAYLYRGYVKNLRGLKKTQNHDFPLNHDFFREAGAQNPQTTNNNI